jgi:hypothetical protein
MKAKTLYINPCIEIIYLDNEISLALQSSPPEGPDEGFDYKANNPFRNQPQESTLSV